MMRFIADMGVSPKVVDWLLAQGHDAVHLHRIGLGRLPDHEILIRALEEQRVLLTADLDFGKLMAAGGNLLPSIVLFRLPFMGSAAVIRHLTKVLDLCGDELADGMFVTVAEGRIRARHLPIGQSEAE